MVSKFFTHSKIRASRRHNCYDGICRWHTFYRETESRCGHAPVCLRLSVSWRQGVQRSSVHDPPNRPARQFWTERLARLWCVAGEFRVDAPVQTRREGRVAISFRGLQSFQPSELRQSDYRKPGDDESTVRPIDPNPCRET